MSHNSYDRNTDLPAEPTELRDFYRTTAAFLMAHGECDTEGEIYGFPEIFELAEDGLSLMSSSLMYGTTPVAYYTHLRPQTLASFFPVATGVLPLLHAGLSLSYEEPFLAIEGDRLEREDGYVLTRIRGQQAPTSYYVSVDQAGEVSSGLFVEGSSESGPIKSLELLILSSLVKSWARLVSQRKGIQHRSEW